MSDINFSNYKATHYLVLVGFALLLTTLPWLPLTPFFTRGEAREALVAQSMAETGNYILPSGYSNDLPSKPPIMHWAISAVHKITGSVDEFSARLPSLASALLITLFLAWIVLQQRDTAYRLAPFILLTSFEWIRAAVSCRVDMLHAASMVGGLLTYFLWKEQKRSFYLPLTIPLLTAAVLSKGPVGVAIPAIVIFIYEIIRKEGMARAILTASIILLPAALLASFWYILAYNQGGDPFLDKVWYENGQRFLGSMDDPPHNHTVFYLYGIFLVGLMPWTVLFFRSLRFRRGVVFKKLWQDPLFQFSVVASLSVIFFYSIPSSKRGVYVLAAYPFVAILLSPIVNFLFGEVPRVVVQTTKMVAFICVILATLSAVLVYLWPLEVANWQYLLSVPLVIYSCRCLKQKYIKFPALIVLLLLLAVFANGFILPAVASINPEKTIALELERININQEPVFSFRQEFYATSLYSNTQITRYPSTSPSGLILLKKKHFPLLKGKTKILKEWQQGLEASDRDILLVRVD